MPMTTMNHLPLRRSFKAISVASPLTFTNFWYSSSSRVKILTSMEPLTDRVSLMTWFISSVLAWLSLSSNQRVLPALRVGRISRGMMAIPTRASCQLMENSATNVVMTVAVLLTILERVPLITVLTPLISVFIRVMISPCFSVVKKE